jgi:hypothetical protein
MARYVHTDHFGRVASSLKTAFEGDLSMLATMSGQLSWTPYQISRDMHCEFRGREPPRWMRSLRAQPLSIPAGNPLPTIKLALSRCTSNREVLFLDAALC